VILNLNKSKKIVITGPPGTGKTTIKRVYFDLANPIKLIETSLEPTRGINSSVYSIFNSNLGIFDLAGQENDNWYGKDKNIFSQSSVIFCVFDIRSSLESIIKFILKVLKLKKESKMYNCRIITFLHKIDLVKPSYISIKVKAIKDFFRVKYPEGLNVKIYKTSIAKEFFIQTYYSLLEILTLLLKEDLIPISKSEFENLKKELSIIMKCGISIKYSKHDLAYKFKFNSQEVNFHLRRLEYLGFIKFSTRFPIFFRLTQRANYFKIILEREQNKVGESEISKEIEFSYFFSNISKKK